MNHPSTAFCFDLDGVVTSQELLPLIAEELGYYEEIKALTDATIKGIIPFESSFRLRCRIPVSYTHLTLPTNREV